MAWKFPGSPSALTNKKILLIESSEAIRDLQAALLKNYGIQVHVARDIPQAKAQCLSHSHDLIVVERLDACTSAAEQFCAELKRRNPQQKVALLAAPAAFPLESAADEIISTGDGPTICTHRLKWMLAEAAP